MEFLKRLTVVLSLILISHLSLNAQYVKKIPRRQMPENIILLIGDGMGVAQIQSGLTINYGKLNLLEFVKIGFSKTQPVRGYVTDSAAGATAIASGRKTYNGAIGVTIDSLPAKSILEYAEEHDRATGLVSTSAITHATPASFISHTLSRDDYEAIAVDFLNTDIDVFIGGGINHFAHRKDNRNLIKELRDKNYQVTFSIDSARMIRDGKLAALTAPEHNPGILDGRNNMLTEATRTAINILSKNQNGFFLMVEGSEIDWSAHANNTEGVALEVVDFDKAIGAALEFAKSNGKTLVIVTADHETGGMALTNGNFTTGKVMGAFSTTGHTGVMVPVFAFGPGADLFQGIQENTDLFYKMMALFGFKPDLSGN